MRGESRVFILLLSLTAFSPTATADGDGPWLGGYVKSYAFQQAVTPWDLKRAGARLQLSVEGGNGDPVSYFAALDFDLNLPELLARGEEASRSLKVYPVEMYVQLSLGPVELKAGQQYVLWGRTTWVNPTDLLTAWDFPNMASEIEDYRIAPVALRLDWYMAQDLRLDLVWVPFFQPNRLGMKAPAAIAGLPVETEHKIPGGSIQDGEFGIRLSQSISELAFDWAVCGYYGFDKYPTVSVQPVMGTGGRIEAMNWTRSYQRLGMAGMDFAKSLDPFLVKGEAALYITEDWEGDDPGSRNSGIQAVLGTEYSLSPDVTLEAQYILNWLKDYDEAMERAYLNKSGAGSGAFVEAAMDHEMSLFLKAKISDEIGLQFTGLYSITYNDFFSLAFLWWSPSDGLKLYLGGVAFGGTDMNTKYARHEKESQLFAELKYSF